MMTSENKTLTKTTAATWLKRIALGVLIFLVILILVIALIPSSAWKRLIVYEVTKTTHRQAAIDGNVEVHLLRWEPQVIIDGFTLANVDWAKSRNMVKVDHFDASVSLWSLIKFNPVFPHLIIDGPDIDLQRDAKGRANWDFSPPGAATPKPPAKSGPMQLPLIRHVTVSNGELHANDRIGKLKFDGKVTVNEREGAGGGLAVKGNGSLNEKPFGLDFSGGPLADIDSGSPYRFDATVTAADIKLVAHTDILHPFDMAHVNSKFRVTGKDLADIYYLSGLALPNTPPYDISGTVERDNAQLTINDFKGRLGNSDIEGKVGIDTGGVRPKLTAKLASKMLDIVDLAAPLGAQAKPADKADTLANSTAAVSPGSKRPHATSKKPNTEEEPPQSALLLPDADLQVNRVRAMDADLQFDALAIKTQKMPLKNMSLHLLLNDGKITIDPLAFSLPQGHLSGSVGIDARGAAPVTDLNMQIDKVDLAQFKPKNAETSPMTGTMVGRIKLHGSGSSIHKTAMTSVGDITVVIPNGEIREAFVELTGINISRGLALLITKNQKATELRCGIINFHAAEGDLTATTLVVDTTNMLVTGKGKIDLENENIDLSIHGQPKGIRLFRLRSPIELSGTLSKPSVGLQTTSVIGQAGAAAALGVLLTPAAAVLAFVDGGLAKDANCQALMSEAEQGKNLPHAPDPAKAPPGPAKR